MLFETYSNIEQKYILMDSDRNAFQICVYVRYLFKLQFLTELLLQDMYLKQIIIE